MGRHHPAKHDTFIRCDNPRCGARNAPEESPEFDRECYRCGEPLDAKPEVGDVVDVDVVDETDDGTPVCKTEGGFVLFLEGVEYAGIEATVRVTEVEDTSGTAELVDEE